jgi:CRP-like cAMP-binding protein
MPLKSHVRAVARNLLIERLPPEARRRLLARCESVPLVLAEVLCRQGDATRHVYFPVDGFISLAASGADHPALEVGMVGREGMLGTQLALGVPTVPILALVQGAGAAWRLDAATFTNELGRSAPLRRVLARYVHVLMSQTALSALCMRFHHIGPRLARRLLMTHDRAHADHFHITHELLACMLGVRRVGITTAAGALQKLGLISYHRGELKVLDRPGLEASACGCYAVNQQTYADAFDPGRRGRPTAADP